MRTISLSILLYLTGCGLNAPSKQISETITSENSGLNHESEQSQDEINSPVYEESFGISHANWKKWAIKTCKSLRDQGAKHVADAAKKTCKYRQETGLFDSNQGGDDNQCHELQHKFDQVHTKFVARKCKNHKAPAFNYTAVNSVFGYTGFKYKYK